jgi:hypothetical protein
MGPWGREAEQEGGPSPGMNHAPQALESVFLSMEFETRLEQKTYI